MKKTLVEYYANVDNGGTTFSLVEDHSVGAPPLRSIEISDSYFGYSKNVMKLYSLCAGKKSPQDLREIANFFSLAASILEEQLNNDV